MASSDRPWRLPTGQRTMMMHLHLSLSDASQKVVLAGRLLLSLWAYGLLDPVSQGTSCLYETCGA